MALTWSTSTDWDNAVSEAGVLHETRGDLAGAGVIQIGNPVQSDYLAYYPCHDDSGTAVTDESGNGNDGFDFDGTHNATGILNGGAFNIALDQSFDYAGTVNPASSTAFTVAGFGKLEANSEEQNFLINHKGTDNEVALGIFYDNTTDFTIKAESYDGTTVRSVDSGVDTLGDGLYHWYVATFDGTDLKIYIDGTLEGTNNVGGSMDLTTSENRVGFFNPFYHNWIGDLCEIAVIDAVWSATKISDMWDGYNGGHLETATKTEAGGFKPKITNLSYNLNGESITVKVIGSPGTGSEETVTQVLGGASEYLLNWTNSHTDFRVRIEPSTTDVETSPTFSAVTLEEQLVLSVDATTDTSIDLSWPDIGAASYDLYRAQTSGSVVGDYTKIADPTGTTYSDTGLENGEQYFYRIATDGSTDLSDEVSPTTTLPGPSGTSLNTATEDEITVSWNNNDNSTDGTIKVYRSEDGSKGTEVFSTTTLSTTSYVDTGLEDGELYYYTVERNTDHVTETDTQVSGTTVLPTLTGLSLDSATEDQIGLSWTNNDDSIDGDINIYRSEDGTTGSIVATVAYNATTYTDTGLEDGELYYYTVERDTGHATQTTSQQSATTVLPNPSGVSATPGVGEITVSWTNNDDSTDGDIDIYRSTSSGTLGSVLTTVSRTTSTYTDTVSAGTTYYYTVRRLTDHESADSTQVSAEADGIVGNKTFMGWHSRSDWDMPQSSSGLISRSEAGRTNEDLACGYPTDNEDLVALYTFEDTGTTLTDIVGGYDGTMQDATYITTGTTGLNGKSAWTFEDNEASVVNLPNMGFYGNTGFGVIANVYPTSGGTDGGCIFSVGGDDDYEQLWVGVNSTLDGILYSAGTNTGDTLGGDFHEYFAGDFSNTWVQIGLYYDSNTETMHTTFNGDSKSAVSLSSPLKLQNHRYRIGASEVGRASAGDNIREFIGRISEVAVYDTNDTTNELPKAYDMFTSGSMFSSKKKP